MSNRTMVNSYEILTEMDGAGFLNLLVKKGIIPITFLDYKTIYECYLKHREDKKKMRSYECAAIDCSVSEKTVRLVVKQMES